jgi:hypothetical protein
MSSLNMARKPNPTLTMAMAAMHMIPMDVHRTTNFEPSTTSFTTSSTPCKATSITSGIAVTAAMDAEVPARYQAAVQNKLKVLNAAVDAAV